MFNNLLKSNKYSAVFSDVIRKSNINSIKNYKEYIKFQVIGMVQ